MRGKLRRRGGFPCRARNIPAYAGKTRWSISPRLIIAEHPRVCGENVCLNLPLGGCGGTSPRMRGKRPAIRGWKSDEQEHPRVCGENGAYPVDIEQIHGTSPRMRGKPTVQHLQPRLGRNIPAYAGKTQVAGSPVPLRKEHPRVCGENGKPLPGCLRPGRNIPAYAGKTMSCR